MGFPPPLTNNKVTRRVAFFICGARPTQTIKPPIQADFTLRRYG
ncbi:MAG: hypothetical protein JWP38_2304 [Herbaspirillum sp.]|jgi:hypothetical protein|nr:hypothetical protein [Herbaspirillum sp.]